MASVAYKKLLVLSYRKQPTDENIGRVVAPLAHSGYATVTIPNHDVTSSVGRVHQVQGVQKKVAQNLLVNGH